MRHLIQHIATHNSDTKLVNYCRNLNDVYLNKHFHCTVLFRLTIRYMVNLLLVGLDWHTHAFWFGSRCHMTVNRMTRTASSPNVQPLKQNHFYVIQHVSSSIITKYGSLLNAHRMEAVVHWLSHLTRYLWISVRRV